MSYIYYKIPYEGSLQKIQELINDRGWNLQMKSPKEGILLAKIPKDIEEEISFNQKMTIDEETKTKFGSFQPIRDIEFEEENSTELTNLNYEKQNIFGRPNKKYKNAEYKRQMSEILLSGETKEEEKPKGMVFNILNKIGIPKIDLNELRQKIETNYKDPYDYFFSQNYLVVYFIVTIIFLVLFRF